MLNVKQGSYEYQLLKAFGPTRSGNRTLVYQLRGRSLGTRRFASIAIAYQMQPAAGETCLFLGLIRFTGVTRNFEWGPKMEKFCDIILVTYIR